MPRNWIAAAAAAVVLSGCSAGSTAPDVPAAPAEPTEQNIHTVEIRFDSITVMGNCDRNSVFESAVDGEFEFLVTIADAQGIKRDYKHTAITALEEGTHLLGWEARIRRDLTEQLGLRVHFWASELDGILGHDPEMSDKNRWVTHQWDGTKWSGDRKIELVSSAKCGVRLRYSITSAPID
jgi:hypothetical protein